MTDEDEQDREAEEDADEASVSPEGSQSSRRFRAATEDELDPQRFMVADSRSALRVVLRGGSIANDRGDAHFIGGVLRRLAEALRESAEVYRAGTGLISNAQLRRLEFGHSVAVELEISREEDVQIGIEGERHAPTIDAARALAEMLGSRPDELVPQAIRLGPDATAAYKHLLEILAGDAVTFEWQVPDRDQVAVLSSADARHDYAILNREGEQKIETVTVPGRLTMADSELRKFALTLPSELARPPLLKGKHRIRGTYPEDVGSRLKSQGLWDSNVMATIEVTFDVPGTTSTPRDSTYVLVDVEPLASATPNLFE